MSDIILEMKHITKAFSGVKALDDVNLQVKKGEIHALCGENGAGKSTLMNVLSGVYPHGTYEGDIIYKGETCKFHRIKDSEEKGIVIIHQELISQLKKAASENRLENRIKWFCRYKLLIIDELGYQKMDVDSANLFFNLIAKRYEKLSTIITTNSPFSKWSDIFQEPVLTNALLDRLLHHCSVININGPSYRMKDQMQYMSEEN